MVRTDAYGIEVDDQFALMQSLKQFKAIGRSLLRRNIQALYPESELDTFMTTDSPVVLGATSKVPKGAPLGFGSAEAVILFPVSKRCALAMSGASEQFRQVTQSQREVDWFNIQVAKNSYRYVFATAETELKTLADAIGIAGSECDVKLPSGHAGRWHRTDNPSTSIKVSLWPKR